MMMQPRTLWIINLNVRRLYSISNEYVPRLATSVKFYSTIQKPTETNISKKPKSSKEIADLNSTKSYLDEILIPRKEEPKTTAQKVKKKAENTFYYAVFFGSVVALGALGYYFLEQFFASDSPQAIYSNALKLIKNDDRCEELYGTGIKGYGEDTGRGRRRHIASQRYITKEGEERVRVMFHVKGDRHTGKVFAEIAKKDGNWDYRFIYTVTDDTVPRTVVLVDNRESK